MAKENHDYCAVADYDELEPEDQEIALRRMKTYSKEALKLGIKVDNIIVMHPAFKDALGALDRVFQIAPQVRMPHGVRLMGPSGSGTSTVSRYFQESLPNSTLFERGYGCVRIRVGTTPSAGRIIASLLRLYDYPFGRGSEREAYWRQPIAFELVRAKGTRLIVFEDAHRLVDTGGGGRYDSESNRTAAASLICELMDEAHVGVVLAGRESLYRLDETHEGLAARVTSSYALYNFAADAAWSGIIKGFVNACTWFDLSHVNGDAQAKLLHLAAAGNLRALKRLLTEAVLVAAEAKCSAINGDHLKEAFVLVYGKAAVARSPYA
jgi:hypothetical protein